MSGSISWVLVALSSGSAGAALWWALKMKAQLKQMNNKYAPIIYIDEYITTEKASLQSRLESVNQEINTAKNNWKPTKIDT